MYRIDVCPCCNNRNLSIWPALLSPFVSGYATNGSVNMVDFASCPVCGFRFFLDRYNDDEMAKLYNNYHGEEYYKIRHSYEFYYTRVFNDAIGDAKEESHRKARFLQFLNRNNIMNRVSSIIDWGGDRGQMIPDIIPERYVYEISNFAPVSGAIRLTDKQEAMSRHFDMVMCCNVLEHCSDPGAMIRQLTELNVDFFYLEIPVEVFRIIRIMPNKWYRKYTGLISKLPRYLRACLDLFTIACRVKLKIIPPFAVLNESEHINFFTKDSISKLLINNGLEPIEISCCDYQWSMGNQQFLVLAQRKSPGVR